MPDRRSLVLAIMSPAGERRYSPVQVQKLFFLVDRNVATHLGGQLFQFRPYNYGPFDRAVYDDLEALSAQGLVELSRQQTWTAYGLTEEGQRVGKAVLDQLPPPVQAYAARAAEFVLALDFTQLVSSIYKAYPEMRANSVFQE